MSEEIKKELTPEEMIDKGLEASDMEMVKRGRELQKRVVKGPDKKVKTVKLKVKAVKPVGIVKKKKTSSDGDFVKELMKIQEEREQLILSGKAGPLIGTPNSFVDSNKSFKEDLAITKQLAKAQKTKTPPRPPIEFIEKQCPRCNRTIKVSSNELGQYNFDVNNDVSELPTYRCSQCS